MAKYTGRRQPNRSAAQAANAGRRRRRRRNRTLHYVLLLLFLVGAGAVLSFTVFFQIERVEVFGVDRYSPDEVVEATGIVLGEDNLFRIDKPEMEQVLLERFPYIDSLKIRRKFPPAVEITVYQAEPVGAVLYRDEVVLIGEGGKVLERGILLVPEGVLVVKGISVEGAVPGDVLGSYEPVAVSSGEEVPAEELRKEEMAGEIREKLQMLRLLREAMEESGFTAITNVDLTDRLNMQVNYENRITLILGSETDLSEKLRRAAWVLEELEANATGIINASEVSRNRVYFRASTREADEVIPLDRPLDESEMEEESEKDA